jgi:hypothetical protein
MRLTALILILAMSAAAHAQTQPLERSTILFRTKWDAHNTQVRIRPMGDTSAPWTVRMARRHDSRTFKVIPEQWDRVVVDTTTAWTMEARIPKWQLNRRRVLGARVAGAILGAATTILYGATCEDSSGEGPSCKIVFLFTPATAVLGAQVGRIVGEALPVREWQKVSIVK